MFTFPDFNLTAGLRANSKAGDHMEHYKNLDSDGTVSPGTRVLENDVLIGRNTEIQFLIPKYWECNSCHFIIVMNILYFLYYNYNALILN